MTRNQKYQKPAYWGIKELSIVALLSFFLSSCWAPRCPMDTCRSKYEHRHDDLVSGVFSPRFGVPHKMHFLWDKDKGEENPDTEFVPGSNSGGKKKKPKKRYPWERW
ncbi:hypothetical protein [Jiulongibacter sediminis]|jgi:hypothetical protein|uniref:Lipoprotein n=1 Tax=Jiulongibacter sediminis TaxID=1605367 RepID=A0A0P7BXF3_9BACT|nr:hypothetical protein [Jiulongibacter sediminis]KPM49258.1 hypothetical protein AFM12_01110 [Jiulongibacter sediminis]TBX26313.1 hypothetical protein TK44_01110 [Jiulongibacter sediminis]